VTFSEDCDQDLFNRVVLADDNFLQLILYVGDSGENDFGHSFRS
jgi:hypothetical protein